jgi:hypothetical protein
MEELSAALAAGMTPVVSYWTSEDMLWLDGAVAEAQYPFLNNVPGKGNGVNSREPRRKMSGCKKDTPNDCGEKVKLYNFAIEKISRVRATVVQMQQSSAAEVSGEKGQQVNNLTLLGAPASVGVAHQGVDPSAATPGGCAQAWQQCNGGPGWVGPVCCEDGCDCLNSNDGTGFSQCKPSEGRTVCGSSGNSDFLVQRFEGDHEPRSGMLGGRLPFHGVAMLGTSIVMASSCVWQFEVIIVTCPA